MDDGEKLLSRMRTSRAGWSERDIEKLLTSFGFTFRQATHGRLYYHPSYPQLALNVAHRRELGKYYITASVKLIDDLKKLEIQHERKS